MLAIILHWHQWNRQITIFSPFLKFFSSQLLQQLQHSFFLHFSIIIICVHSPIWKNSRAFSKNCSVKCSKRNTRLHYYHTLFTKQQIFQFVLQNLHKLPNKILFSPFRARKKFLYKSKAKGENPQWHSAAFSYHARGGGAGKKLRLQYQCRIRK